MPDTVECGGCGTRLSEEFTGIPRKPCPNCGAMNRVFSASLAHAKYNVSGTAIDSLLSYGHTGRKVLGSEAERRAEEWRLANRDELLSHPVAEEFRASVSSAPVLSGDSLVLFRGRDIRESEQRPPTVEQMGPLPLNYIPRGNRYNREGKRALYLADSEDGVRREMKVWHTEGTPYVIRIEVPLTSLRIVDFSNWPTDDLITAVFARAETCNVGQRGPTNYIFSQAVGELVSERFDGMRIPGVHGTPGAHYKNIVLFRRLEDWSNWANPANPAYRMFPPSHEHIAVAAYYLWEKDGRVHGRDQAHWFQAIKDLK